MSRTAEQSAEHRANESGVRVDDKPSTIHLDDDRRSDDAGTGRRRHQEPERRPFWSGAHAVLLIRLAADLFVVFEALLIASYVRFELRWFEVVESTSSTGEAHLAAAGVWIGSILASATINRLYDEDTLSPGEGEIGRVIRTVVEAVAVLSIFAFFTHMLEISRSWFALVAILTTVAFVGERLVVRALLRRARRRGRNRRPAILISKSGTTWPEEFVEKLEDFDVVAHIDDMALQRYLSVGSRLEERRSNPKVWENAAFIVRAAEFDDDELWRLVLQAGQSGSSVFLHSSVRSVGRDRLTVRKVSGHTMVKISPPRLHGIQAFQKRLLDIVGSLVALCIVSPLLLLISVAILVTSGRPIFYGQERVGQAGRIFTMWKFRSMKRDAEKETGPTWTAEHDARVTRIGKWLRRLSLDELPQFWNVLRGDMSLVGPRPERPVFVDRFSEELGWYQYRHRIRPGVTGWAQAHGLRGNTPLDWRVEFDNWYIEHWTIALDIRILARTFLEVVRGEHAY